MIIESDIRILIVDDNLLIRSATKMILKTCKTFTVVGEASDGAAGVKLALELEPDIVLMDINMQPVNGIEATRRLSADLPNAVVIGFSALPHPHEEQEMLLAGALGVINKTSARETICTRILELYRQHVSR